MVDEQHPPLVLADPPILSFAPDAGDGTSSLSQPLSSLSHFMDVAESVEQTISSVANTRATLVPASIDALMIASINISNAKYQAKYDIGRHGGDDTKDAF